MYEYLQCTFLHWHTIISRPVVYLIIQLPVVGEEIVQTWWASNTSTTNMNIMNILWTMLVSEVHCSPARMTVYYWLAAFVCDQLIPLLSVQCLFVKKINKNYMHFSCHLNLSRIIWSFSVFECYDPLAPCVNSSILSITANTEEPVMNWYVPVKFPASISWIQRPCFEPS